MYYDEEAEINMSFTPPDAPAPAYTYSSSDEYTATVNNDGTVEAKHVGECVIDISTSDGISTKSSVTVKPRSKLYTEPYLTFGGTKSDVKGYEKRTVSSEDLTGIVYKGENSNVRNVVYLFEGGKMTAVGVLLANTVYCIEEAHKFLTERYDYLLVDDGLFLFKGKGRIIGFSYADGLGLHALYIPDTDTKNFTPARFDELKQRLLLEIGNINH